MTQREAAYNSGHPIVSSTTILILSGTLIGMAIGKFVQYDFLSLLAGVCGLIAFVGLKRLRDTYAAKNALFALERRLHLESDRRP